MVHAAGGRAASGLAAPDSEALTPGASSTSPRPITELVDAVRRYAASMGLARHDVDDVAQEALERTLRAKGELESEAVLGYALLVARNLVRDQHRAHRVRQRRAHLLVDRREPEQPSEAFEAAEERRSLRRALDGLPPEHRDLLLAHDVSGVPLDRAADDQSPAALAAQLARTRARLRVDYLLHRRRTPLPTPRCRPVLLALSLGDRRRQSRLRSGTHLIHCAACAELAPALLQRRHGAIWLVLPLAVLAAGMLRHLARWLSRPVPAAATGTAAVAAAVMIAVTVSGGGGGQPVGGGGQPVGPLVDRRGSLLEHRHDLGRDVGMRVIGRGVRVVAVPSDEGFWVGRDRQRVWVQLTGKGESPQRSRAGARVWFRGTVVPNAPRFASRVDLAPAEGAAELRRQRFHVAVPADAVDLRRP